MSAQGSEPSYSWSASQLYEFLKERYPDRPTVPVSQLEKILSSGLAYNSHDSISIRFSVPPPQEDDGIFLEHYYRSNKYHLQLHYAAQAPVMASTYSLDACEDYFRSKRVDCNRKFQMQTDEMSLRKALRLYHDFYGQRQRFKFPATSTQANRKLRAS